MKILFLSTVVWNLYRGRHQDVPLALAKLSNECIYAEPIKYGNWEEVGKERFQDRSKNDVPGSLEVLPRKSKVKRSLFFLLYENWKNCRLIRKVKPDAVVSNDIFMSVLPCIYARLRKIRFIFDVLDDLEGMEENLPEKIYLKFCAIPVVARFSSAVTSLSYKQTEKYKRYNRNVFHVPNGKSLDFVMEAEKYCDAPKNEVNFVVAPRSVYDFNLAFEVFREFPDIKLNIYGQGPLYDHLVKKAREYDNVNVCGSVDSSEVPRLTAESLFGILPLAVSELNESTSPTKLFDYWACRKAVVARPTSELKKLGGKCVLFAENKEEFIEAIKKLLDDRGLMQSLGEAGFKKVKETYNYDNIGKVYQDIIKNLAIGRH